MNYHGTVRIRNPKTLRKWIKRGWYQEMLDQGLTFAPACGRFKPEKCTCSKCRNSKSPRLLPIVEEFENK